MKYSLLFSGDEAKSLVAQIRTRSLPAVTIDGQRFSVLNIKDSGGRDGYDQWLLELGDQVHRVSVRFDPQTTTAKVFHLRPVPTGDLPLAGFSGPNLAGTTPREEWVGLLTNGVVFVPVEMKTFDFGRAQ